MKKINELGKYGEKLGVNILNQMGFTTRFEALDRGFHGQSSYDILARKLGIKYAINIKYGNTFVIQARNVERLLQIKDEHGYIPAYLFIGSPQHAWLFSLDKILTQLEPLNMKLGLYQ